MGNGREKSSSMNSDVGLPFKMQEDEWLYPGKRTGGVTHHHLPPPCYQPLASTLEANPGFLGGGGGTPPALSSGGPNFTFTRDLQVASSGYGRDIHNALVASAAPTVSGGGGMPLSGKALFTASQLQELERQTMIYKYISNSIPVPPELVLPFSKYPSRAPLSQSNTPTVDLRFSGGSDPEPWRCRRTDGKKWRCSRDVAPDQKYCERHAHKSRPRSRKPVETLSRNPTSNHTQHPLILPANTPTGTRPQHIDKSVSHFQTLSPAPSCEQSRSIEWLMRGGSDSIPESTCDQQQWQPLMQTSLRPDYVHQHNEEKQAAMNLNPYIGDLAGQRFINYQLNEQGSVSFLHAGVSSLLGSCLDVGSAHPPRHFIDAWSAAEKEGPDVINSKDNSLSSSRRPPISSLSLSMSADYGIDDEDEYEHTAGESTARISIMDSGIRSGEGTSNPISWVSSTPGGPLGEALCLGNGTARGT